MTENEPQFILGLDPGKITGWGIIKVKGRNMSIMDFGELRYLDKAFDVGRLIKLLGDADEVIYETWFTDGRQAQKGDFNQDEMWAPQAIGVIKAFCLLQGIQPRTSNRAQKPVGYGYLGMKYVKGKQGMHAPDALAHAAKYAVDSLKCLPLGKP